MPKRSAKPGRWKISRLRDHPRQRELFGDLPESELAALAADIDERGLQHPIAILPDGTILAGHQRVRAARRLGWTEIDVTMRSDLADDPEAAEQFFISDNLRRRHLTRLGRVRCIQHLLESAGERTEAIKTQIGEQLGMSLRTVNRYLLIARAPREIQQAFDRGELSLVEAGRAAALEGSQPELVAEPIAAGESPRPVLQEFLARDDRCNDRVGGVFTRFISALRRDVPLLEGRVGEIDRRQLADKAERLRAARNLVDRLLERAE